MQHKNQPNPHPIDPDTGKPYKDAYLEGWFAGMDDGETEPCTQAHNPYATETADHERWDMGLRHGQEQDESEADDQDAE